MDGKLVGLISLTDIALESERERRSSKERLIRSTEVADILGAVSQPHPHAILANYLRARAGRDGIHAQAADQTRTNLQIAQVGGEEKFFFR